MYDYQYPEGGVSVPLYDYQYPCTIISTSESDHGLVSRFGNEALDAAVAGVELDQLPPFALHWVGHVSLDCVLVLV